MCACSPFHIFIFNVARDTNAPHCTSQTYVHSKQETNQVARALPASWLVYDYDICLFVADLYALVLSLDLYAPRVDDFFFFFCRVHNRWAPYAQRRGQRRVQVRGEDPGEGGHGGVAGRRGPGADQGGQRLRRPRAGEARRGQAGRRRQVSGGHLCAAVGPQVQSRQETRRGALQSHPAARKNNNRRSRRSGGGGRRGVCARSCRSPPRHAAAPSASASPAASALRS